MSFAPGQFITAQRLNRLQTKSYFSQASGSTPAGNGNISGTAINIPVETNGATAAFTYSASCYSVTGAMGSNSNTFAKWDVNTSPNFAVVQQAASTDKVTAANVWSTTISTAGTYTFQLGYNIVANSTMSVYTSMMVQIIEVA
jgi:hypothetical protein